ncbi:MAG: hypothetical protein AABY13_04675 [Nanoarchaeota archaeon]
MVIHISTLLKHYKRPEVQRALVDASQDREVGVFYAGNNTYGKRPDVLNYPRDVMEFVTKGATSFHISEERWSNPLGIVTGASRRDQDDLRIGWDLIIDIDCPWLDYSKVAAHVIAQKFRSMGIGCFTMKFSGNHGFHIAIPFEAFPPTATVEGKERDVKDLFPEGPRKIAAYLQDEIRTPLGRLLVEKFTLDGIKNTTGKTHVELVKQGPKGPYVDPFSLLAIDTVLIASRHLVRAPYSMHDKSGLVSIPIDPDTVIDFDKKTAAPDVITFERKFLDRSRAKPNEARLIFDNAFAHKLPSSPLRVLNEDIEKAMKHQEDTIPTEALAESMFPPCMHNIKKGLKDGKKRAMFAAVNFLVLAGWEYDKIEEWLLQWNKNNQEALREVHIKGHIRYHKANKKKMPPPRCRQYYKDLGVCQPDSLCDRIKNPIQYAKRRAFMASMDQKPKRKKSTDENVKGEVEIGTMKGD